jgi:hypothetical protein
MNCPQPTRAASALSVLDAGVNGGQSLRQVL